MGKQNYNPGEAQDLMNKQLVTGESLISIEDAFKSIEKATDEMFEETTSTYFNFEKPGKYMFIFNGTDEITIDGKTTKIVKLIDKSGAHFVNGNVVIVNQLSKLQQIPCFVRIDYLGEEKSASGTYKNFRIYKIREQKQKDL